MGDGVEVWGVGVGGREGVLAVDMSSDEKKYYRKLGIKVFTNILPVIPCLLFLAVANLLPTAFWFPASYVNLTL